MMKKLILISLFFFSAQVLAAGLPVSDKPTLVVVHAQETYDKKKTAKPEIDAYIEKFKAENNNIIFLIRTKPELGDEADFKISWYPVDIKPTHRISSAGGEHRVAYKNNTFFITGGFFALHDPGVGCLSTAMSYVIDNYFRTSKDNKEIIINLPLYAMYYYAFDTGDADHIRKNLFSKPIEYLEYLSSHVLFEGVFHAYVPKSTLRDDHLQIKTGYIFPAIRPPNTYYYNFIFRRDGVEIHKMGIGAKTVIINFITNRL